MLSLLGRQRRGLLLRENWLDMMAFGVGKEIVRDKVRDEEQSNRVVDPLVWDKGKADLCTQLRILCCFSYKANMTTRPQHNIP